MAARRTEDDKDVLVRELEEEPEKLNDELKQIEFGKILDTHVEDIASIQYVSSILDWETMYGSNWAQPIGAVTHEALKMENLLASIPTDRKTSHEDKLKSIMDEVKDCVENLHHPRDDTDKMKSIPFHPMQINQGQPSNKAWGGGLLTEWLKFESSVVEDVQLSTCGSDSARRLTSNGRKVLRGILKRVEELHDSGCIHGDINTDTIIVSPHLDVLLLPPKLVKNQSPTEDLHNLHLVVEAMMYQRQSPLDVIHLKELLKRPTTELGAAFSRRRHLAFNHPCIWEVDETVQIILAIGCDYKSSSKAKFAQSAKNIPNSVTAGWVETIKRDNFYARLYQEWVNDMAKNKNEYFDGYDNREDGVRMPLFMRNCLQHPNGKTAEEIERDVYVFFPLFLCTFFETMSDAIPQGITS
ncbi:hypothetical protein RHGRI_029064 [Rhododendron griersonianum]|uniref:Protein kinase domain-containing protein n=1 Tax=Rhododendron griersonianum TaxID=479676 RepID=A0AAV6IID1_9ERIC|nr:hypothetical protein RHGRI_029064 [Rhododendron griersonianum]